MRFLISSDFAFILLIMSNEAFKLVLWPREETQVNGETVRVYIVVGTVVTNKPLDWPNETLLMGVGKSKITDFLSAEIEKGNGYTPPYPLGDANGVILSLGDLTPKNCQKKA